MPNNRVLDFEWTEAQRRRYAEDGFVVVERLIDPAFAKALEARYDRLFAGKFETGTNPDNFPVQVEEGDPKPITRWMTNPWLSDHTVANFAFHPVFGKLIARLNGWSGTRLLQNNIHWKPPGAPALSMHQDASYHLWCEPADLSSVWVALEETTAEGGTLLFARGSHRWPRLDMAEYRARIEALNLEGFLKPQDFRTFVDRSAEFAAVKPELVPVEVPAGGGAFFQGWVWHGSDANRTNRHRYSISNHGIRRETRFHPTEPANVFGRYKRFKDTAMDEAHFPVLWCDDGYRTDFLDAYMIEGSGAGLRV